MGRCGLSIEIFSSKISQRMIREYFVGVDLAAFLGVFWGSGQPWSLFDGKTGGGAADVHF